MNFEQQYLADAESLLRKNGYVVGEYNPHKVSAYLFCDEYSHLGLAIGSHESEALDNAMDAGILDRLLMSEEDHKEYSENGWDDSFTYAGNAGEPIWTEHLTIRKVLTA